MKQPNIKCLISNVNVSLGLPERLGKYEEDKDSNGKLLMGMQVGRASVVRGESVYHD